MHGRRTKTKKVGLCLEVWYKLEWVRRIDLVASQKAGQ